MGANGIFGEGSKQRGEQRGKVRVYIAGNMALNAAFPAFPVATSVCSRMPAFALLRHGSTKIADFVSGHASAML
jgi:hypothetical protein